MASGSSGCAITCACLCALEPLATSGTGYSFLSSSSIYFEAFRKASPAAWSWLRAKCSRRPWDTPNSFDTLAIGCTSTTLAHRIASSNKGLPIRRHGIEGTNRFSRFIPENEKRQRVFFIKGKRTRRVFFPFDWLAEEMAEAAEEEVTFADLGVSPVLCRAMTSIGWTKPTEIQRLAIPEALNGRDIIGLAETGSGKTGAFAIPILDALLKAPSKYFALILSPTRELAFQTNEVLEALGSSMALVVACIVGGIDFVEQSIALAKQPHIITATPGRLVDHLQNTKGFSLRNLKYLVLDEADRMLSLDFEKVTSYS